MSSALQTKLDFPSVSHISILASLFFHAVWWSCRVLLYSTGMRGKEGASKISGDIGIKSLIPATRVSRELKKLYKEFRSVTSKPRFTLPLGSPSGDEGEAA